MTGLRVSKYQLNDDLLFEPRVNLSYDLNSKIKLISAFGIHYQFANQIVNQNISEGSREFWLLSDGDLIDLSNSLFLSFFKISTIPLTAFFWLWSMRERMFCKVSEE